MGDRAPAAAAATETSIMPRIRLRMLLTVSGLIGSMITLTSRKLLKKIVSTTPMLLLPGRTMLLLPLPAILLAPPKSIRMSAIIVPKKLNFIPERSQEQERRHRFRPLRLRGLL